MPQLLELAQFIDQHGVSQVKVRCRGIETRLDTQRTPFFQFGNQLLFHKDFIRSSLDNF